MITRRAMAMGAAGAMALGAWAGAAGAETVEVRTRGVKFSPAALEIAAGDTVHWINDDFLPHTVTSESGPDVLMPDGLFASGVLSPGQTFDFTFDEPGEYFYYCEIHGQHMQGTVTVLAPCVVDLNEDGIVDFADYLEFLNLYDAGDLRVDFNDDGIVDFADYLEFLNLYDAGC